VNLNALMERLSDQGRAAIHWAFLCALREQKQEVRPSDLLIGIQCANPKLLSSDDLSRIGFSAIDVSDVRQIQQEMQELSMKASIANAKEKSSGEATGFAIPFAANARNIFDLALKSSDSFGTKTVGTPHLLWAIVQSDADLAGRLAQVNLDESQILVQCGKYMDGREGESASQMYEKMRPRTTRCGIGYDLHRLAEGRPLIVGGITLPFDKGPVGHSDGDVLAHAMCDALLGAAALGDIGTHFPDTDPKWKGANSLIFLEYARKLLDEKHLKIEHVDAVVITEKPKLGPHFPKMREALAKSLGVAPERIHLKAKTNEGVDAIGRGEAIAAHVVATLSSS
jgi:2-C-methyl-D-erythritol 2,4-cyclodiphosphate synthase